MVQNEKKIINVTGTGYITLVDGSVRAVDVVGYFKMFHWTFIVHHDIDFPECFAVSEASTGCILLDVCYATIEAAVAAAIYYGNSKQLYFSTATGNIKVKFNRDISKANGCLLTLPVC